MKTKTLLTILIIGIVLLGACAGPSTAPTKLPAATETPASPMPTTKETPSISTSTPIPTPTLVPTTTTVPTVVSTSPTLNAVSVMVNTPITVTFSEEMNSSVITASSFMLKSNDKPVSGKVTCTGNTATFTPTEELAYSTTYTVTVTKQAKNLAGHGLSADYSWNFKTRDAGILEGALNYVGKYPVPALVTYVDSTNKQVSVTAYPGQVQVYYDSKVAASEVETIIKAKSGTVIGKIPLIGYYLVQVTVGQEGNFITALQTDKRLKLALPNIALSLEGDGVQINEDFVTQPIPVPLNITGPVLIDTGEHAKELLHVAEDAGTEICQVVGLSNISDKNGDFSTDKMVFTLTAIAQGNSIFNPGHPAYVNMSNGAGAKVNGEWVDYNILNDAGKQAAINGWKDAMLTKLQAVEQLPDDLQSQLVITQSAGNCNMPIGQPLQEIRNEFPELGLVLRDSFTICSTDLSPANIDRSRYPSGKSANTAPDDKDVVMINDPLAVKGTSYIALVAFINMIQTAKEVGGLTPAQTNAAFKMAALYNASPFGKGQTMISTLSLALKIKSISDSILRDGKGTQKQVDQAMWLAFTINYYRDLVPEEVFTEMETISLTADDPTAAMWVTSIKISYAGPDTLAVITPAIEGVTVQYTVTTTGGKTYHGSLKTDASGRVLFSVPPGVCEEIYTYTVTAVLSGKTATTQFMFYYE